jgi:hypothetical protein
MPKSVFECIICTSRIIVVSFSYMRFRPIYRLSDQYLHSLRVLSLFFLPRSVAEIRPYLGITHLLNRDSFLNTFKARFIETNPRLMSIPNFKGRCAIPEYMGPRIIDSRSAVLAPG